MGGASERVEGKYNLGLAEAEWIKGHGQLVAFDALSGEKKWTVTAPSPYTSGVLTTAGNLAFAGTPEGQFKAYDVHSGKELWSYQTGSGIVGSPVAFSIDGKQYRASTKEDSVERAKEVAEDWYFGLRGKARAGILKTEKTFAKAAEQFLKEYEVITEGQRSPRWTEGHAIRIRLHLDPFFGELGLSEVTAGKVQEYRVHRMSAPASKPNAKTKDKGKVKDAANTEAGADGEGPKSRPWKPPARSTLHDEVVTRLDEMVIASAFLGELPGYGDRREVLGATLSPDERGRILDRIAHRGRAVTEHHGAHAGIVVDQLVAVGVEQIRAFAVGEDERVRLHAGAEVGIDAAGDPLAVLLDQPRRLLEREQLAVHSHSPLHALR